MNNFYGVRQDTEMQNFYTPPKSAPLPDDFDEFYASLTQEERELHQLAIDMLQSSYFVQWCHMYRKWKANRNKSS